VVCAARRARGHDASSYAQPKSTRAPISYASSPPRRYALQRSRHLIRAQYGRARGSVDDVRVRWQERCGSKMRCAPARCIACEPPSSPRQRRAEARMCDCCLREPRCRAARECAMCTCYARRHASFHFPSRIRACLKECTFVYLPLPHFDTPCC